MTHANNKVKWCMKKADNEYKESNKHRGIRKVQPDKEKAYEHIKKAEHYLKATIHLKQGNFSDISASTVFYSIYHCLLAIAVKLGYESNNQECTFALISSLIDEDKISLEKNILNKISFGTEHTIVKIREQYQYGTSLTLKEDIYAEQLELAKKIIASAKSIIEEDL